MSVCTNNSVVARSTKARLHDRMAWEEQVKLAHRDRFYVPPSDRDTYIPSASLLATTEARNSDARTWNNHVQSLSATVTIKTNFAPVKEHVLRLTKARLQEICLLQEQRKLKDLFKNPPPPRYLLSSFMPSAHLLSSTKARAMDALAWQTTKAQADWHFSAQVVMHLPPPSEHLLAPTKSQIAAMDAWQVQKANAPFVDDIWWEKRRPTPCSDYHHRHAAHLPSKVTEVTVSFSLSMRSKYVDEHVLLVEEQTQLAMAVSHTRRHMPHLTQESHLLTKTQATVQCAWSTMIQRRDQQVVDVRHLDLPSRVSYPAQRHVRSKLYEDTAATRLHRWDETTHLLTRRKSIRRMTANDPAHRLLRTTRAVVSQQTQCFAGHVQDTREKRWNVHTTRAQSMLENPFEDDRWRQVTEKRRRQSRYANTPSKVYATHHETPHHHHRNLKKQASFTSTEVRAVVSKAVNAALVEAKTHQGKKNKTVSSSAVSSLNAVSPVPSTTRSSVLRQQKQLAAATAAAAVAANKNKKMLTMSSSVKKTAKKTATVSPVSQRVPETRSQILQAKIDELMRLTADITPIKPAAGVSLVFEDLSDCVSPMSSFDEMDHHDTGALMSRHQSHYALVDTTTEQQQQLIAETLVDLNLSAPTIDECDHDTSAHRLSLDTTKLSSETQHVSHKQQPAVVVFETTLADKTPSFWKKQQDLQMQEEAFQQRALDVFDGSDEDTVVMEVTPQVPLETTILLA